MVNTMSEPTKLQMLVAEISGNAESSYIGLNKQIPFRVRLDLFARLSALNDLANEKKKTPRNHLLNDLIEIALDEVISNLSPEDQQRLEEVESHYYMDLQQYESGELSDD